MIYPWALLGLLLCFPVIGGEKYNADIYDKYVSEYDYALLDKQRTVRAERGVIYDSANVLTIVEQAFALAVDQNVVTTVWNNAVAHSTACMITFGSCHTFHRHDSCFIIMLRPTDRNSLNMSYG
jgi:hypothetical protein